MTTSPITSSQVSNYIALQPLMNSLKSGNDHLPKNSLPHNTQGTIQENTDKAAKAVPSIYNAHGIVTRNNPNSLIAYA